MIFLFCSSTLDLVLAQSPDKALVVSRIYYRENVDLGGSTGYIYFENDLSFGDFDNTMTYAYSLCGKYSDSLNLAPTGYNNNITITPFLSGDADNGATSLDLVRITRHYLGISQLPTAWDSISADADDNDVIDSLDTDMIRRVILGIDDEYTRPNWEWLPGWVTVDNSTSFEADPYSFFGYTNSYPPASTTTVLGDIPKYFHFKATKVGDVDASSSEICIGVNNFGSEVLASRTVSKWSGVSIEEDEHLLVDINIVPESDLVSFQLPIAYDEDDFELTSVTFSDGTPLKDYRFHKKRGHLILLHYLPSTLPFSSSHDELKITMKLKAKRRIYDVSSSISWSIDADPELVGDDYNYTAGQADLIIRTIIPKEISGRILGMDNHHLELKLTLDETIVLEIYSISGQLLHRNQHQLNAGYNLLEIPNVNQAGIFLASTTVGGKRYTYKFIK